MTHLSAASDEILKRLADAIDDGRDDDGAFEGLQHETWEGE